MSAQEYPDSAVHDAPPSTQPGQYSLYVADPQYSVGHVSQVEYDGVPAHEVTAAVVVQPGQYVELQSYSVPHSAHDVTTLSPVQAPEPTAVVHPGQLHDPRFV
jgi:hypothetical protein